MIWRRYFLPLAADKEQIVYIYKAKELIYRTLAQNVITPNLKYDVKIVQED